MASTNSCNISFSYKGTQDLPSLLNFAWGSELAVLLVYNIQSQGKEERLGVIKSRYLKRKVGKEPLKKEKKSQNKSGVINKKMIFFLKIQADTYFAFLINSEQKIFPNVTTQNLTKRRINDWTLIWWVLSPLCLYEHWMNVTLWFSRKTHSQRKSVCTVNKRTCNFPSVGFGIGVGSHTLNQSHRAHTHTHTSYLDLHSHLIPSI